MFHFGTDHHANGGTASCRSAVFFCLEEDGRGRERESGRRGEDLERMGEDSGRTGTGIGGWERTLRGGKRTERIGNGLGGRRNETFRMAKQGL